jgi:DNA polymerase-3 subunit alpha
MLNFEKEVLGIYVSGHPLEDYRSLLKGNVTANASDFMLDPETDTVKIEDGSRAVIGGMIADKTIKYTKTNRAMAFITLEDLYGTVEVIVFPNDFERYARYLNQDAKVFVEGKVSVEEDKDGKLILEKLTPFEDIPRELWVRFKDRVSFEADKARLESMIKTEPGRDRVIVYLNAEKQYLPLAGAFVDAQTPLLDSLKEAFGAENIHLTQTTLVSKSGGKYGRKN